MDLFPLAAIQYSVEIIKKFFSDKNVFLDIHTHDDIFIASYVLESFLVDSYSIKTIKQPRSLDNPIYRMM